MNPDDKRRISTQNVKGGNLEDNILVTDHSGRVITLKEFRELQEADIDRDESVKLVIQGSNKHSKDETHIFSDIAHTEEKNKPISGSRKESNIITCRYCGCQVRRRDIQLHNRVAHPEEIQIESKIVQNKFPLNRDQNNTHKSYIAPKGQDGNIAEILRKALTKRQNIEKGPGFLRHERVGKIGSDLLKTVKKETLSPIPVERCLPSGSKLKEYTNAAGDLSKQQISKPTTGYFGGRTKTNLTDYFKGIEDGKDSAKKEKSSDNPGSSQFEGNTHKTKVQNEKNINQNDLGGFVGSKNRNKFHLRDCKWVSYIFHSNNLIEFSTWQEAIKSGYKPCGSCCGRIEDYK